MTAPDLSTAITDALEEHTLHMLTMESDDPNGAWVVECNCDMLPVSVSGFLGGEKWFAAHQAAMLAPVIREANAKAWDSGVAIALNHAILNEDGITLRLAHLDGRPWANPFRADQTEEP